MKIIRRNVFICCLIILVILLSILAKDSLAQDEEILTGVVKATAWKKNGEVTAVVLVVVYEEEDEAIITTYTDEYLIEKDSTGIELFGLVGETVEVIGELLEDEDGVISLKVISYMLIEPEDKDYQEDEPEEPNE